MSMDNLMMVIIACLVIVGGVFMAFRGKVTMVRDRFSEGVAPEDERKFMMTIGGGICVIGLTLLSISLLDWKLDLSQQQILIGLAIGIVVFLAVIVYGQKKYRHLR